MHLADKWHSCSQTTEFLHCTPMEASSILKNQCKWLCLSTPFYLCSISQEAFFMFLKQCSFNDFPTTISIHLSLPSLFAHTAALLFSLTFFTPWQDCPFNSSILSVRQMYLPWIPPLTNISHFAYTWQNFASTVTTVTQIISTIMLALICIPKYHVTLLFFSGKTIILGILWVRTRNS